MPGARVVASAITVTEVLRGGGREAAGHLSGHRCAIDAIVAATAVTLDPPIVLLTSDPDDMDKLVSEPARPKAEQIAVVRV